MTKTTPVAGEKSIVWNTVRTIYRFLATDEAQKIVNLLLKNNEIRSKELMNKAELTESQFHPLMRQLVKYQIIEKIVGQDRGVSYKISTFGKNVLEISEQLLKELKAKIPEIVAK